MCTFPECTRPTLRRGLCKGHLEQQRLGKPLSPLSRRGKKPLDIVRICHYPDCPFPVIAKDVCWGHYRQLYRGQALRPLKFTRRRPRTSDS